MDKFARISLLYDFYGALLSKRQKEVTDLYYGDNLSLAEIGEEFGITRQGVYDALHSAEKSLEGYEEKLGLVARFAKRDEGIRAVNDKIDTILKRLEEDDLKDEKITAELGSIKDIVRDITD